MFVHHRRLLPLSAGPPVVAKRQHVRLPLSGLYFANNREIFQRSLFAWSEVTPGSSSRRLFGVSRRRCFQKLLGTFAVVFLKAPARGFRRFSAEAFDMMMDKGFLWPSRWIPSVVRQGPSGTPCRRLRSTPAITSSEQREVKVLANSRACGFAPNSEP